MGKNGDIAGSVKENINLFIMALHPQHEKYPLGSLYHQCPVIKRFKYINVGTTYLTLTHEKWIPLPHFLVFHNELEERSNSLFLRKCCNRFIWHSAPHLVHGEQPCISLGNLIPERSNGSAHNAPKSQGETESEPLLILREKPALGR